MTGQVVKQGSGRRSARLQTGEGPHLYLLCMWVIPLVQGAAKGFELRDDVVRHVALVESPEQAAQPLAVVVHLSLAARLLRGGRAGRVQRAQRSDDRLPVRPHLAQLLQSKKWYIWMAFCRQLNQCLLHNRIEINVHVGLQQTESASKGKTYYVRMAFVCRPTSVCCITRSHLLSTPTCIKWHAAGVRRRSG